MKNALLVEKTKIVTGLAPITPSSSTPDYVSLKNYTHLTAIITVDNGATVTGSAITLKQATAVAGTDEKALGIDRVWVNEDTAASDALTKTDVESDTFTTDETDNKNLMYVIEVDAAELDIDGGFDCVRVGTGNASNTVLSVVYILSGARYAQATPPSAIVN
ncbi:MAG: hypothetical protein M0Q95_11055 [Porticoccaceae bacterium]|nr:hypothetical protein [Porticoccaceae bacterium]